MDLATSAESVRLCFLPSNLWRLQEGHSRVLQLEGKHAAGTDVSTFAHNMSPAYSSWPALHIDGRLLDCRMPGCPAQMSVA